MNKFEYVGKFVLLTILLVGSTCLTAYIAREGLYMQWRIASASAVLVFSLMLLSHVIERKQEKALQEEKDALLSGKKK